MIYSDSIPTFREQDQEFSEIVSPILILIWKGEKEGRENFERGSLILGSNLPLFSQLCDFGQVASPMKFHFPHRKWG